MLTIMIIASCLLLFMVALAIVRSGKSADAENAVIKWRFEQRKKEIEEMKSWRQEKRKGNEERTLEQDNYNPLLNPLNPLSPLSPVSIWNNESDHNHKNSAPTEQSHDSHSHGHSDHGSSSHSDHGSHDYGSSDSSSYDSSSSGGDF